MISSINKGKDWKFKYGSARSGRICQIAYREKLKYHDKCSHYNLPLQSSEQSERVEGHRITNGTRNLNFKIRDFLMWIKFHVEKSINQLLLTRQVWTVKFPPDIAISFRHFVQLRFSNVLLDFPSDIYTGIRDHLLNQQLRPLRLETLHLL